MAVKICNECGAEVPEDNLCPECGSDPWGILKKGMAERLSGLNYVESTFNVLRETIKDMLNTEFAAGQIAGISAERDTARQRLLSPESGTSDIVTGVFYLAYYLYKLTQDTPLVISVKNPFTCGFDLYSAQFKKTDEGFDVLVNDVRVPLTEIGVFAVVKNSPEEVTRKD